MKLKISLNFLPASLLVGAPTIEKVLIECNRKVVLLDLGFREFADCCRKVDEIGRRELSPIAHCVLTELTLN